MKAGFTTSVVMHAALIGFGLVTLRAPAPLDAGASESFPVDIVPIEEVAQSVQGDKEAPVAERSAPTPTTRPEIVEQAETVGNNTVDLEPTDSLDPSARQIETAALPSSPEPTPRPEPVTEPEPAPAEPVEPKPVPATEVAPDPAPAQEVEPDPVPESVAEEAPAEESLPLPASAPQPQARPKPPQAQTAKAPERKKPEKPVEEVAKKPQAEESEFDAEEIAALLNKEAPKGGGAKRSTEQASLGGRNTTGAKLSQSEMDALSSQLAGCWTIPAGAEGVEGLRVSVKFNLDTSGKLDGRPVIETASGDRSFDESAVRAVQKCDRQGLNLPSDKADTWAEVVVNFDPSAMF